MITAFAEIMERKLRANDWKTGFSSADAFCLMSRLLEEAAELLTAVARSASKQEIAEEAADVANFACMVAFVCQGLPDMDDADERGR